MKSDRTLRDEGKLFYSPFNLLNYFAEIRRVTSYPARKPRYNRYGWNHFHQHCYDTEDIKLLARIKREHDTLENAQAKYFDLKYENYFYGWWQCAEPEYLLNEDNESYTLPSREARDPKIFPLWNFADNMAKRIANWQGERIKHQPIELLNDPVMLIFAELRDWFFITLAEKECKKNVLDIISKRQSYIKNLIHLIPSYGPDRLYLHELQQTLSEAVSLIISCVANKELPQLLTELSISGKSLETITGTYLHFLLIDEEVADNFAFDSLEKSDCRLFPLCKIYSSATSALLKSQQDELINQYSVLNRFYDILKISNIPNETPRWTLQLRNHATNGVKFAYFVTQQDKDNYLDAVATLEALVGVRKTLEQFQSIQSKVGTYSFAMHYLRQVNALATHYLNLINKMKLLSNQLIYTADRGLNEILKSNQVGNHKFFEKNLRALETRVAKGTTMRAQLDTYCLYAAENMNKYQQEVKKLAANFQVGKAATDIERSMKDLLRQINQLNTFLPGIIDREYIEITDTFDVAAVTTQLVSAEERDTFSASFICEEGADSCASECAVPIEEMVTRPFDYGEWDDAIVYDSDTAEPIFTYRVYKGAHEVGAARFYGQPLLCLSPDRSGHNLLETTGVLSEFHIRPEMSIEEVCLRLPPTLFKRVLFATHHAAFHGALRGGAQVMGCVLASYGTPPAIAQVLRYASYYGGFFSLRFATYYQQVEEYDAIQQCLNAAYLAAIETGELFIIHTLLRVGDYLFQRAGSLIQDHFSQGLGHAIKQVGSWLRFSMFGYQSYQNGLLPSCAALFSGTAAEVVTVKMGHYLVKKH